MKVGTGNQQGYADKAIICVARGTMEGRSVKHNWWSAPFGASCQVKDARREMMEKIGRLKMQTLSVRRDYTALVLGLMNNKTIKNLCFIHFGPLSVPTQELICNVAESNRTLEYFAARFQDQDSSCYCLELFLRANRGKWMDRIMDHHDDNNNFNNNDATTPEALIDVLIESQTPPNVRGA